MTTDGLLLAVEIDGAALDPLSLRETVTAAERAGFALATLSDAPVPPPAGGRLEAGVRAAYLAQLTRRIGLAPTLHVTTTEPFHLATQLASLDHASHGRAAWVVGAANDGPARATIGAEPLDDAALRQEIRDVIDVARALWDSWEDDAVIKDVAAGRFLDDGKVHHIRFTGASFSVVGPLITPRPPQGQVVVIAPDTLGVADRADITLVGSDPQNRGRRADQAREAGSPLVFADLDVALDRPDELAGLLAGLGTQVDGVLFRPAGTAGFLARAAGALPALIAGGVVRAPGPDGATLRDVLGLPRPANRFAGPPPAASVRSTSRV